MTLLKQRMLEDLRIRNYSPSTVECYSRSVAEFAKHFNQSPEHLGPEEIRKWQLHLLNEKQVKLSTYIQAVCGLRFFYRNTLNRKIEIDRIPLPRYEAGADLCSLRTLPPQGTDPEFLHTLLARRKLASLTFDILPFNPPSKPGIHSIPIDSGPAQFNLILSAMLRPGFSEPSAFTAGALPIESLTLCCSNPFDGPAF